MMSLCHYGDHGAMQPYSMALLDAMVDFFNLTFIPSPDLAHAYAFWSSFSHTSNSSPALTCWHIMVNNGQAHNYQVPGHIKIAKKMVALCHSSNKNLPQAFRICLHRGSTPHLLAGETAEGVKTGGYKWRGFKINAMCHILFHTCKIQSTGFFLCRILIWLIHATTHQ